MAVGPLEAAEERLRERQVVQDFLRPRIDRAAQIYSHALTALWVGNAGAALAMLSFIGATWKNGGFYAPLIWPLLCFVLGLMFMGLGSLFALLNTAGAIRRMEEVDSVLDLNLDDIQNESEAIGLTLSDARTRSALIAAGLFMMGCAIGILQLFSSV